MSNKKEPQILGLGMFRHLFKHQTEQEEGQGLVEYALVLMLIAIVVIAILIFLGPQIGSMFSAVTKGLS